MMRPITFCNDGIGKLDIYVYRQEGLNVYYAHLGPATHPHATEHIGDIYKINGATFRLVRIFEKVCGMPSDAVRP